MAYLCDVEDIEDEERKRLPNNYGIAEDKPDWKQDGMQYIHGSHR